MSRQIKRLIAEEENQAKLLEYSEFLDINEKEYCAVSAGGFFYLTKEYLVTVKTNAKSTR